MKNTMKIFAVLFLLGSIVMVSCNKDEWADEEGTSSAEIMLTNSENINLKSDTDAPVAGEYEKVVVNPIVKGEDCKFPVSGTIEYRLDGVTIATVDFGDGTCDNIATKTVDGETYEFELNRKGKGGKAKYQLRKRFKKGDECRFEYEKVVVSPLVKTEDCDYIVEGIIEFYKDGEWVATIDFGDGICDDMVTKTTAEGTFEFSQDDYRYGGKGEYDKD
jgi:hypothetical protein